MQWNYPGFPPGHPLYDDSTFRTMIAQQGRQGSVPNYSRLGAFPLLDTSGRAGPPHQTQAQLEAENPGLGWWRGNGNGLDLNYGGMQYPQVGFPSSAHEAGQRIHQGFESYRNAQIMPQTPEERAAVDLFAGPDHEISTGASGPDSSVLRFLAGLQGQPDPSLPLADTAAPPTAPRDISPIPGLPGAPFAVSDPIAPQTVPVASLDAGPVGGGFGGVRAGSGPGGGFAGGGGGSGVPQMPLIDPATYPAPPQRQLAETDLSRYYEAERAALEAMRPQAPEETGWGGMLLQALAGGAIGLAAGESPQAGVAGALGALVLGQREEDQEKDRYTEQVNAFNRELLGLTREQAREERGLVRENQGISYQNEADQWKHNIGIIDTNTQRQFDNEKIAFDFRQKQIDRARADAAAARESLDVRIQLDPASGKYFKIMTNKRTGETSVQQVIYDEVLNQLDFNERVGKLSGNLDGIKVDMADADTLGQLLPQEKLGMLRARDDIANNTPVGRAAVHDKTILLLQQWGFLRPDQVNDPAAVDAARTLSNTQKQGQLDAEATRLARVALAAMHTNAANNGQ